jgi:6-phosphogluconolactonase
MPVFDLILLGLGQDGHAASLFLDRFIDPEGTAWVESVIIPASYPTRERITLTLPVLNSAAHVAFLVSGESKRETLIEVLNGAAAGKEKYAAQLVKPRADIMWFTDIKV